MLNEDQILDEVEKTLRSFDAEATLKDNDFLATRIKAERENRLHKRHNALFSRIDLRRAVLLVIFLVNIITMVHYLEWNKTQDLHEKLVSELKIDFQIDQGQNTF